MWLEDFKKARYQNIAFFILLILTGICLLFPYHNFQLHLAQGDHGNNLYAFRKTLEGSEPYRDYWWVYGPLMPYYYAFFLKIFGTNIHSVLVGYCFLQFLCGIVFYFILRQFFVAYMSLTAAVFFWIFNTPFEHTYNHIGGILVILIMIYFLFKYLKEQRNLFLYFALASVYVLALIKLNFGLAMLLAFVLWFVMICRLNGDRDILRDRKILGAVLVIVPLCILVSYWYFLKGLPVEVIRQCLLFVDTDPNHSSLWNSLKTFVHYYLFQLSEQNLTGFGVLFLACCFCFIFLWKRKMTESDKRELRLVFLTLILFLIFGLHEFLVSGVVYRMFWIEPLRILGVFIIMFSVVKYYAKSVRWLTCIFILWAAISNHIVRYQYMQYIKQPVLLERAQIYITNGYPWLKTVVQATDFLKSNLRNNETFLALPSEEIYYFLTDKNCPVRQAEYGLKVSDEQEQEALKAIQSDRVKYILLSNRFKEPETGMGAFGDTYCHRLGEYIRDHYKIIAVFGEWKKEPEWFANHGVVIAEKIKE